MARASSNVISSSRRRRHAQNGRGTTRASSSSFGNQTRGFWRELRRNIAGSKYGTPFLNFGVAENAPAADAGEKDVRSREFHRQVRMLSRDKSRRRGSPSVSAVSIDPHVRTPARGLFLSSFRERPWHDALGVKKGGAEGERNYSLTPPAEDCAALFLGWWFTKVLLTTTQSATGLGVTCLTLGSPPALAGSGQCRQPCLDNFPALRL